MFVLLAQLVIPCVGKPLSLNFTAAAVAIVVDLSAASLLATILTDFTFSPSSSWNFKNPTIDLKANFLSVDFATATYALEKEEIT